MSAHADAVGVGQHRNAAPVCPQVGTSLLSEQLTSCAGCSWAGGMLISTCTSAELLTSSWSLQLEVVWLTAREAVTWQALLTDSLS